MLLDPRASVNTRHVHCFSKKPWCWINAKVKLSVFLRCGQVDLFLSFQVRFECSRLINVSWLVLHWLLSKNSKETLKMKLMTSMMLCNKASQKFVDLVDNKHVHTIVLPFGVHFTHSFPWYRGGHSLGEAWVGIGYKNEHVHQNSTPTEQQHLNNSFEAISWWK